MTLKSFPLYQKDIFASHRPKSITSIELRYRKKKKKNENYIGRKNT